jgi:hypothetical protein
MGVLNAPPPRAGGVPALKRPGLGRELDQARFPTIPGAFSRALRPNGLTVYHGRLVAVFNNKINYLGLPFG